MSPSSEASVLGHLDPLLRQGRNIVQKHVNRRKPPTLWQPGTERQRGGTRHKTVLGLTPAPKPHFAASIAYKECCQILNPAHLSLGIDR